MKKLYLTLMAVVMASVTAFAQEREMYFSFGEDIVDNNAELTYYGGEEQWCPNSFKNGFIANIIAHVDVDINGFARVVLTALDKQEACLYPFDDESTDRAITFAPSYAVSVKFRALKGHKEELTIQCPTDVANTTGGFKYSKRMKLEIQRLAGDGTDPDNYETVESFTLVFSNNPKDVFNPPVDPVDPPVDPVDPPVDPVDPPVDDPDDPDTGVSSVEGDNGAEVHYYNLDGTEVSGTPAPGLYLRRQGSKVTKIVVSGNI